MNRLVIIGNGFDLAHGLPTGYSHFINSYWIKVCQYLNTKDNFEKYFNDEFVSLDLSVKNHYEGNPLYELKNVSTYEEVLDIINNFIRICGVLPLNFKNEFFEIICKGYSTKNWVDIENEYYQLLKECLKEEDNTKVKKLNEEFEQVKNLFEKYLTEEVYEKYDFDKPSTEINELIELFSVKDRFLKAIKFYQEFPSQDRSELALFTVGMIDYKEQHYDITSTINKNGIMIRNLFLNFNYTLTFDEVKKRLINSNNQYYGESELIYIHGKINDIGNKINFGFGDEMDDDYKTIENKNDNEYLKYIKSFQYAQNDNYKKLLDFIDSEKFQVYIMGHSCGLSDRILLNTVFEHENCRSIKIFFHKKEDESDNYTDIVQNISRHFNDKKVMRSKIVNKSLCQPLPQDIRFEEKK